MRQLVLALVVIGVASITGTLSSEGIASTSTVYTIAVGLGLVALVALLTYGIYRREQRRALAARVAVRDVEAILFGRIQTETNHQLAVLVVANRDRTAAPATVEQSMTGPTGRPVGVVKDDGTATNPWQ